MSNWLNHVKKTMKLHPGKALKDVLKIASKTYKRSSRVVKYAVTGKKRTRKHRGKSRKAKRKSAKKHKRRRSRGRKPRK